MLIKELCDRYGITSRKTLYNRLNALNLELPKDLDGRAYATNEQVELLDQLDRHLSEGGTLARFTPITQVTIHRENQELSSVPETSDLTTQHTAQLTTQVTNELLGEMIKAISAAIQPQDPLHYMTLLERAADKDWILSTSEVTKLIGVRPKTEKGKHSLTRGCWCFVKTGKIGNESGWKVVKVV